MQWRSQDTDNTHLFILFWLGVGWGHAPLVNFVILEVATQIVRETIFWNALGLESGVVLTHDFGKFCSDTSTPEMM